MFPLGVVRAEAPEKGSSFFNQIKAIIIIVIFRLRLTITRVLEKAEIFLYERNVIFLLLNKTC